MNVNLLKTAALLILVCLHHFLFPQNSEQYTFSCVNFEEKVSFFELDSYGNIYTVDQKNCLTKFNLQGELIFTYSNQVNGSISSIDVQNPQKIMIFYKDAAIIQFLNEQLAPITEPISLFKLNYFNISLVAFSNANTISMFDFSNLKLITLDLFLKEKSQFQILNSSLQPTKLISFGNNKLLLQDPKEGFLFFDSFGTLEKEITLQIPNDFQIFDSKIFFVQDSTIKEYNFEKLELLQIPFSEISKNIPQFITVKKSGPFLIGLDSLGKMFIGTKNF